MLVLYDYYRSSACFRVRIALNLKNVEYQIKKIDLVKAGGQQFSGEYTKVNPQSLVPALDDDGKIITQSLAITGYLDERFPEPPLAPSDPYQKALVKSMALLIASEIHPLNNLRVRKYLSEQLKLPEAQSKEWYHHWIHKGFTALEAQLVASPFTGDYCFGDTPTIADICLVPQVFNAIRMDVNLEKYPTIMRIYHFFEKHPAVKKAWPKED